MRPGGLVKRLGVVCACEFGGFILEGEGGLRVGLLYVQVGGLGRYVFLLLGGAKWGDDR